MNPRRVAALLAVLAMVAAIAGCDRGETREEPQPSAVPGAEYGETLRDQVTADAMMKHLERLQQIANDNKGNRAAGTPGYDASLDYVAGVLRDKGFDVATPEFTFRSFDAGQPSVTVGGAGIGAYPLMYTIGTPPAGVNGPLVAAPPDDTSGCSASDYKGLQVTGAVALADRGACPFADKMKAAASSGAVALIVADNVVEERMGGTLGEATDVTIPVVSVSKADGQRLRSEPGPVTIKLDATVRDITSRNVVAQTKTGSTENVVVAGAHLDSVEAGPGINDNGSGVAAVLETAVQMGPSPQVQNAVRFAFWGGEEEGLRGSESYVRSLDENGLKDIALYLNFDMIGSPNPGYFTYDGNQSTPPGNDEAPPRVPEGSAGIERTLMAYLDSAGKPAQDTRYDGRSDYDAFIRAGIPAGGLFSGGSDNKTQEQATLWGGQADEPFDPNYHQPSDTVDHINRDALGIMGAGVAFAAGLYAQDLSGRNGLPLREDRTRHQLTG